VPPLPLTPAANVSRPAARPSALVPSRRALTPVSRVAPPTRALPAGPSVSAVPAGAPAANPSTPALPGLVGSKPESDPLDRMLEEILRGATR